MPLKEPRESKADINQFSLPIARILQALLYLLSKTSRPYSSSCATSRLSRAPRESSPMFVEEKRVQCPEVPPPFWECASLSLNEMWEAW